MMQTVIVRCPCDITNADRVREEILDALSSSGTDGVTLNLEGVAEADVTMLQIIVAAARTANAVAPDFRVVSSPAIDLLLARAGLGGWAESVRA